MPYPDFWAVISNPRYPRYKTPTVAPEPSIERVTRAVHLTEGRIGTHMLLWVPSRESVVRPWGHSLHSRDFKSCGGTHRVASEVASELKPQAEAKFHIYCFVLR
jgi:hypothetical protein